MWPIGQKSRQRLVVVLVALVAAFTMGFATSGCTPTNSTGSSTPVAASEKTDPASGLAWINESALNAQAKQTLQLIRQGGPYPYPRNDNVTYYNNNHVLPKKSSGYYREYTVKTPGASNRGTRRIIKGKGGELYYTADHYNTFQRIREGQ